MYNNHPAVAKRTIRASTINIIDDDTTSPLITIDYFGNGYDNNPGYFEWSIVDYDDGVGGDYDAGVSDITISVTYDSTDGSDDFDFELPSIASGIWNLNSSLGEYSIDIYAQDNDDDREIPDSLAAMLLKTQEIFDDDITGPEIILSYIGGDGTDGNPGYFEWSIFDYQSGLSEVHIGINYESTDGSANYTTILVPTSTGVWQIPSNLGIYTIDIFTRDNDNDRVVNDYTTNQSALQQEIIDDDTTAPIITNLYTEFDTQYVNITFEAQDVSGIGEISIYIDGEIVAPVHQDVYTNTYNITIGNVWSEINETHELTIIVTDLDTDRSNDVLNGTLIDSLSFFVTSPTTDIGDTVFTLLLLVVPTMSIIAIKTNKRKTNTNKLKD